MVDDEIREKGRSLCDLGHISVVLADRGLKFGVQSDDSDDVMRA